MQDCRIMFVIGIVGALLIGCGGSGGEAAQSRLMGPMRLTDAFAAAEAVFARHFEIASSDAERGVIESQPKAVNARGERVLGNSPARQIARLRVFAEHGNVIARLAITQQRQETDVQSVVAPPGEAYNSVPNQSPSAGLAATTDKQNLLWRDERRMRAEEARILQELFDALHPEGAAEPLSQPASRESGD